MFISVAHKTSFPLLMKLISIAQLHQSHKRAGTYTNRSKGPRAVYQSKIFPTVSSPWILPFLLSESFFLESFGVLISTYTALTFAWWNTNNSGNTEMLCDSPHHLPLVWNPLPYMHLHGHAAWSCLDLDTVSIVTGRQAGAGLIQWDTMLFSGHWEGQWGS